MDDKVSSAFSVAVIGGTHGNEYTGVWCVRTLECDKRCTTLLGNPAAVAANTRFIDDDLNRQFKTSDLQNPPDTVEGRRAQELNALLGPKEAPTTDLIIDMHTTTCNMGLVLFIAEGDTLMAKLAAHIVKQVPHDDHGRKTRIVIHAIQDRLERHNLGSLAKHSLTIEVGPVPQGLLRHDAADITIRAVVAALDYLEQPLSFEHDLPEYVECFLSAPAVRPGELSGKIPWPARPSGASTLTSGLATPNIPSYMIHKDRQDRDFELIRTGDPLFVYHDGTVITYAGSHGDEVYLYFINGAGYYYEKSGSGISVAWKTQYEVATARCVGTTVENATANGDIKHS
jgi:Succinylglutamate desuccinylase / Aspartoacylase family